VSEPTLLMTHASGGELHQGGRLEATRAADGRLKCDFLVLAAKEIRFSGEGQLNGVVIPLTDGTPLSAQDWCSIYKHALETAKECADQVLNGKIVYVTCAQGWNRSGLIAGMTLCLLGWDDKEAIDRIREVRSWGALSNRAFTSMVSGNRTGVGFV